MRFLVDPDGRMSWKGREVACALGRGGVCDAVDKREGDGCTPAGEWPIRRLMWRSDRIDRPETALPSMPIEPTDGWCDDPTDTAYNQPVRLPYPASAERMWRDEAIYDLVVVLGYNDDPITPGAGSAIFLHLARRDYRSTEGCIALAEQDLLDLLGLARPGDTISIARPPRT